MARKPQVATRIPEDTHESLKQYCDENDISKSDAVRRAIERTYPPEADREHEAGMSITAPQAAIIALQVLILVLVAGGT